MTDKKLQMAMLFDFYGDLLTDKQREYFDLYHNEDLSLSEIAENAGISRQGVHDLIMRAENTLSAVERKTGLIQRFALMQSVADKAAALTGELLAEQAQNGTPSRRLQELYDMLNGLKG
ncbi:YlxM family DNA-binding protein [Oscillospiraceae bacterium CM]|nr:YlxM family DNA-binding protein [Oscillospiraceae bacterium CM]